MILGWNDSHHVFVFPEKEKIERLFSESLRIQCFLIHFTSLVSVAHVLSLKFC